MKKSKFITLVLVSASLTLHSCKKKDHEQKKRVYMRSDTTASYSRTHHSSGSHSSFYVFRPYGSYYNGSYHRSGYYSGGISESSNIGHSATKSSIIRGGMGSRGISVSS